jgi:hypothetical protein
MNDLIETAILSIRRRFAVARQADSLEQQSRNQSFTQPPVFAFSYATARQIPQMGTDIVEDP